MFSKSAHFYDALYSWKDYPAEAKVLHGLIVDAAPGARTLLDVACGTGAHLEHLAAFFEVSGLDLDPELLALARERVPEATLYVGDMRSFDLERRFGAVTCMFSSIGYVREVSRLADAVKAMASHLEPGGVLILEPWFGADEFDDGRTDELEARDGDLQIKRIAFSRKEGSLSFVDFRYEVRRGDGPLETFTEEHVMGLFSDDEYRNAIRGAGLELLAFDPEGPTGRGLYVANDPSSGSRGL